MREGGKSGAGLSHRVPTMVRGVPGSQTKIVNGIVERHGRLDVLINNAGGGAFAGIEDTTLEQWRYTVAVNLDSVFFGMQAGIAAMKDKGGAIVNMASITANIAEPIEIARPNLFLASDDASYMIGGELVVDGGYTAA